MFLQTRAPTSSSCVRRTVHLRSADHFRLTIETAVGLAMGMDSLEAISLQQCRNAISGQSPSRATLNRARFRLDFLHMLLRRGSFAIKNTHEVAKYKSRVWRSCPLCRGLTPPSPNLKLLQVACGAPMVSDRAGSRSVACRATYWSDLGHPGSEG